MKIRKNYTIDEELIVKIKREAKKLDRSESWLVNKSVLEYFNKQK